MSLIQLPKRVRTTHPLIQRVGPWDDLEFIPEATNPSTEPVVLEAMTFVGDWTNQWLAEENAFSKRPITNSPVLHVTAMVEEWGNEKLSLSVNIQEGRFRYAHFASAANKEVFPKLWQAYCRSRGNILVDLFGGSPLSEEEFRKQFVPAMPADALALLTSDNNLVWVRRDANVLLHPSHVHVLGRTLSPTDHSARGAVETTLMKECALPADCIGQIQWLGVSGNEPFEQPIFLGLVKVNVTWSEIQGVWAKAADPDGPVFATRASIRALKKLAATEQLTPSCRNLVLLLRRGMEQGIITS